MLTILKEIKQLLEDILSELKKQKEPTAVTVDSKKVVKHLNSTTRDKVSPEDIPGYQEPVITFRDFNA